MFRKIEASLVSWYIRRKIKKFLEENTMKFGSTATFSIGQISIAFKDSDTSAPKHVTCDGITATNSFDQTTDLAEMKAMWECYKEETLVLVPKAIKLVSETMAGQVDLWIETTRKFKAFEREMELDKLKHYADLKEKSPAAETETAD